MRETWKKGSFLRLDLQIMIRDQKVFQEKGSILNSISGIYELFSKLLFSTKHVTEVKLGGKPCKILL